MKIHHSNEKKSKKKINRAINPNVKWNHKTTICVSNFVPSEIVPLSSWFVTGHERLNDFKTHSFWELQSKVFS